jgi:hypothetical protein
MAKLTSPPKVRPTPEAFVAQKEAEEEYWESFRASSPGSDRSPCSSPSARLPSPAGLPAPAGRFAAPSQEPAEGSQSLQMHPGELSVAERRLMIAVQAEMAKSGEAMWVLLTDEAGAVVAELPADSLSLKTTAVKKANAVLAGMELLAPTNPCAALGLVIPALCGCADKLPLKGAAKVKLPGSRAAAFACSGWASPDVDDALMLAALSAAGMKSNAAGIFQ